MRLRKAFQVPTVTLLVPKLDVNPRRAVLETVRTSELPCSSSLQKTLCSLPLLGAGRASDFSGFLLGLCGAGLRCDAD